MTLLLIGAHEEPLMIKSYVEARPVEQLVSR